MDWVCIGPATTVPTGTGLAQAGTVSPSTQIAQQLQPRFVGGTPPDLIDNSGENAIGFNAIEQQLETLDDVGKAS